ncbi:MAG TPA: hypothetical protein VMU51_03020 [Mycobacteriales bacterium]|nr:hypothetical protein [Mycobacteriales bacterium]
MVREALTNYLTLASGLTEVTKKRAQKAAKALVAQGEAKVGQVSGLAEEILETSRANRSALVSLVRYEVDRALGHVGLVTAEELATLQRRIAELEKALRDRPAAGSVASSVTGAPPPAAAGAVAAEPTPASAPPAGPAPGPAKRARKAAPAKTAKAVPARTAPAKTAKAAPAKAVPVKARPVKAVKAPADAAAGAPATGDAAGPASPAEPPAQAPARPRKATKASKVPAGDPADALEPPVKATRPRPVKASASVAGEPAGTP